MTYNEVKTRLEFLHALSNKFQMVQHYIELLVDKEKLASELVYRTK